MLKTKFIKMDNNDPGVLGADKSKVKYKFPEFNVNAPENVSSDSNVEDQELRTCFIQIPKSVSGYDYVPYVDECRTVHQSSMKLRHQLSVQLGLEYSAQLEIEIPENEDGEITKEVEELMDDYFNGKTEVRGKLLKAITSHLCSDSNDCDDDAENSDNEDPKSEDEFIEQKPAENDSEPEIMELELEEVPMVKPMDFEPVTSEAKKMNRGPQIQTLPQGHQKSRGSPDSNNPANTDNTNIIFVDLVSDDE